ncbi:hypothetical protein [Brevibacillus parabrevis]|nr:hypothetical protein [Brevibacillus parabrevis]
MPVQVKQAEAMLPARVEHGFGFWNLDDAFTSVLTLEQFPAIRT